MGTMNRLLCLMAENKASDMYLSANAPVMLKVKGEVLPVNNQVLPFRAPLELLSEVITPEQRELLELTGELNIGVPVTGVGRFRISGMRQRGSYAVVARFIPNQIPALASLRLPFIFE